MPTSELILLSASPKVGAVDLTSLSALADFALADNAALGPQLAKSKRGQPQDKDRGAVRVAQQIELLLFTLLRQSASITSAKVMTKVPQVQQPSPFLDLSRPVVTLPFLSKWAQQAAADGTKAMVLSELHKAVAPIADTDTSAKGKGTRRRRQPPQSQSHQEDHGAVHVTVAAPCLAPSLLPLLLDMQQGLATDWPGLPPIVACIEVTSPAQPHQLSASVQHSNGSNVHVTLPPAAPVTKKNGTAPPPPTVSATILSLNEADGTAQLQLPADLQSLDHMWMQIVKPLCSGPSAGVTAASLAPAPVVAPSGKGAGGKKASKGAPAALASTQSAAFANTPAGKGSSQAIQPKTSSALPQEPPALPRPIALAIALRVQELLATIHDLCARYFDRSINSPQLANPAAMASAAGLTHFDNCLSSYRRAQRVKALALAAASQSAAIAAPVSAPGSKSGTRAAAAAAAHVDAEQVLSPEERLAQVEKELVETFLSECNKALFTTGPAQPPSGTSKAPAKGQPQQVVTGPSVAAIYSSLSGLLRHRHSTVVDAQVASLLAAVASQLPTLSAIVAAYSSPDQPPQSTSTTAPVGGKQPQAPIAPPSRVRPADFTAISASHVRSFFATAPPPQLMVAVAAKGAASAPTMTQTVPLVALTALPSTILSIVSSLCGLEESMASEVLLGDGVVDASAIARSSTLPLSVAERLQGFLQPTLVSHHSSFKERAPVQEVPLLWYPPQLDGAASMPVATITAPTGRPTSKASQPVIPDRTPQPAVGVSAYNLGTAKHHDGCSVFSINLEAFPSPAVSAAILCEGIRGSVRELAKVRAKVRPTPAAVDTQGAQLWDRTYRTLVEGHRGSEGGAYLRGVANAVTAPAKDIPSLLSAAVGLGAAGEAEAKEVQVLEVVDIEKHNLRLLNRALAETRVRTAAVDREKRSAKHREESAGMDQVDLQSVPLPKGPPAAKAAKDRSVSPATRKGRATSVPPQAGVEAPPPKDQGAIDSMADEQRGMDVLRRTDPIPRKVLGNGQTSYIYVQQRGDVLAQNASETKAVEALLTSNGSAVEKGSLAKRFVGAFFSKTFGGLVKPPSADQQQPQVSSPDGLVNDRSSKAATTDTFAAQRQRVETVMALRSISKAVAKDTCDLKAQREQRYLQVVAQHTIGEADPSDAAEEEEEGRDDTGSVELLSGALKVAPPASARRNSNTSVGPDASQEVYAPPVGSSSQVTAWMNKTLSSTEQQFLLDQAVVHELLKSNFQALTPKFSTSCHYYAEELHAHDQLIPPSVAEQANALSALFPSNVRIAVAGKRLEQAILAGQKGPIGGSSAPAFIRNSRLANTVGYMAAGITNMSTACLDSLPSRQPDATYNDLPTALESNEKKRVASWLFTAAVGARPSYEFTAASLAEAVAENSNAAADAPPSTAASGSVSPALHAPTPLPQLREDDAPWSIFEPQAAQRPQEHLQPAIMLHPTTIGSTVSTRGMAVTAGQRLMRGRRTMVMPYDGSIVEASAPLGKGTGTSMLKYHRPDVTIVGHYTGTGTQVQSIRITAAYQGDGPSPLLTLEGGAMTITDRGADERLAVVTTIRNVVGSAAAACAPMITFQTISTDLSLAVGGYLTPSQQQVDGGVAPHDSSVAALDALAHSQAKERVGVQAIGRQLRESVLAVSSGASQVTNSIPMTSASPSKSKGKGSPAPTARALSPSTQALQVPTGPQATEGSTDKVLLSAAFSAASQVADAKCQAMIRAVTRAAPLYFRPSLPHYQGSLLTVNSGGITADGRARPMPIALSGFSAWFERDHSNGSYVLRTGPREVADLEQSREVCNRTGIVTVRYVSGSVSRMFPDGSTATLLTVPADITTAYYTAVGDQYQLTIEPCQPTFDPLLGCWNLSQTMRSKTHASHELSAGALSVLAATTGPSLDPVGGKPARPPSPGASRGTAATKAPSPPGGTTSGQPRKDAAKASSTDLSIGHHRPHSASLSSADPPMPAATVVGPLPIVIPKYWLLTSQSGSRCARRCVGSVLDAALTAESPSSWSKVASHCSSLLPPILSSVDGSIPSLDAAVSFDAQNLCQVTTRSDGVITALYNGSQLVASSPTSKAATGASKELSVILGKSTADKGTISVAMHADGTTIVSMQPPATVQRSNFVPIPTNFPALDSLVQFISNQSCEKCAGDITSVWPESLGLGSREGGSFATSLAFLIEHPLFPRVFLRRNAPAQPIAQLPHDSFVLYSDQSLLATELVTIRIPPAYTVRPTGNTPLADVPQQGSLQPFFHTRFVRPTGTTIRIMNTLPATTCQEAEHLAATPVLILEPSHVASSLSSPYRQLLVAVATQAFQQGTSILGHIPTSLTGKARHLGTVATNSALHEGCPVFALLPPATAISAPLFRLVDKRNFVTMVCDRTLAVSFKRYTTEQLLLRLAPQGLVAHAVSKRRQEEERIKIAQQQSGNNRSEIGSMETALRIVSRSFIVKYSLIGTPQVTAFHKGREDNLRGHVTRGKTGESDGASTLGDGKAVSITPSTAPSTQSRPDPFQLTAKRDATDSPAHMTERDANAVLSSLGYDYVPLMFVVRGSEGADSPVTYAQLLSPIDMAPYVRQAIAKSNTVPTASDITSSPNEEDDIADKCLSIFGSAAAGPVLSTVITASKSAVSGEPHIEQLQFYESDRVPTLLGGQSAHSSNAQVLHRPHQGLCAWLPKTALPPKRLLLQQSIIADAAGLKESSNATHNFQGHSEHVTRPLRQMLRFSRYSPIIRDAVAAVRLNAESQRRSMVHYTKEVVARSEWEEARNRECGVDALRAKYQTQLEAIQHGAHPTAVPLYGSIPLSAPPAVPSISRDGVSHGSMDDIDIHGDVVVLTLEGAPDSPREGGADHEDPHITFAPDQPPASVAQTTRSTNTTRERAVVYLNQRMLKPPCSSIVTCGPSTVFDFGLLPLPVHMDHEASANPPPLYPYRYQLKGTITNQTNDTVLLVIRNPSKKVDSRTGERSLISAVSVIEGNNMRLGPLSSAPFTIQLETINNEIVRRSIGEALGQINTQEEARMEAVAVAERDGTTPPPPRRFVMDLSERLRIDVVGAVEPIVLKVRASLVLNTSLAKATVPNSNVIIRV